MRVVSLKTVLAGTALLMLALLPWRHLSVPDEGRYLSVAAAMWQQSDWIVPHLNGLPYFHKPPLFYWLAGALYGASAGLAWSGRLVSWLGAVGAMLALATLITATRRRADSEQRLQAREHARWSVLALTLQPLWLLGAQYANLDMLVAGCITAAICAMAGWVLMPTQRTRWAWGSLLAIALGVLAKGLIGVVLPVAVITVWLVWERGWQPLRRLAFWPGWLLLPLLVLPWFLLVEHQHPGFLHYFIVVQHVQRFVGHSFNNVMPFWFYPALLLLALLPWSPALLAQLRGASSRLGSGTPASPARALERLAWVWLAVITLFFSLPASKLVGYILPAVPAAALLIGQWLSTPPGTPAGGARPVGRWMATIGLLICLASVPAVMRFDHKGQPAMARALAAQLQPGDQVVFWGDYFFDLALLMHQVKPVTIIAEKLVPGSDTGDGWEQELLDAADFDRPQGRHLLRQPAAWPAVRCEAPRTWLVVKQSMRAELARVLHAQAPTLSADSTDAYRLVASDECPMPAEQEGRQRNQHQTQTEGHLSR